MEGRALISGVKREKADMLALFPEFGCWVRQNRRLAGGCKGGKTWLSDCAVAIIENPRQLS
ncbi:hypothetical protein RsS62_39330 [Rhizobium dioscoreae]|nr:hypothetical protein RsS62_39330 [Rhizobium dioscoreae]